MAPKSAARSAICAVGPGGMEFAMVIGTGFAVVIGGHWMSAVVIGASFAVVTGRGSASLGVGFAVVIGVVFTVAIGG
eukprot:283871-Chlamydomonas_euryale.AAC.1